MKYLVCRLDAIRPAGTMKSSNHFPMVVEYDEYYNPANIVRKALDSISEDYNPSFEYLVTAMYSDTTHVVSFHKPKPQYFTDVRSYL